MYEWVVVSLDDCRRVVCVNVGVGSEVGMMIHIRC